MKTAVTLLVSLLAVSSAVWVYRSVHTQPAVSKAVFAQFVAWKSRFGKLYASPSENAYRLSVFAAQVDTVAKLNAQYDAYLQRTGQSALSEAMFAVPADADLTTQEFAILKTGLQTPEEEQIEVEAPNDQEYQPNLGQQSGYVTRIRNQEACGSCWAFSTVATLEKLYYDINRVQVDLSQQFLVDCSTTDNGCNGGWPANTYNYVAAYDITFENVYKYKAVRGYCRASEFTYSQYAKLAGKITSRTLPWNIGTAFKLSNAGVNAGLQVHASGAFRYVSSSDDVFDPKFAPDCSLSINHAVNMESATADYVVVQNSWGKTWGREGFKKMKPCNDYALLGSPSYLTHASSNV